jgi:TRAP-type mannitol/chloroaromatic compound transport system permease small subunit
MTETESLIAEVRLLRADVARLHAAVTTMHNPHRWMNMFFKDLSTNPRTQYKVHMWGAIYWLINFPLICCLFFLTPTLWLKLGIFITLIYSIYSNLATDYGGMSAAEAAFGEQQPPPIPLEPTTPM